MENDLPSQASDLMPKVIGAIKWTRLIIVLAILSSLVGALVMFSQGLAWTYLVIPLSILAIAASTRLLQFDSEEDSAQSKEMSK